MFEFEKFSVYLRAEAAFEKINSHILSNREISGETRSQLERASKSIILNIAEGAGKFNKNDKKNFYLIALGSLFESVAIIRTLRLEKKINLKILDQIYDDFENIGKMLSGLINSMLKR